MKLSEHLNSEELVCRCGKCQYSDPDRVQLYIHPLLIEKFEEVRLALKVPIVIRRGVSCWDHHVEIYKEMYGDRWGEYITELSNHLVKQGYFSAIDCAPRVNDLFDASMKFAYFRFSGIILYKDFIHADVGQRQTLYFEDKR